MSLRENTIGIIGLGNMGGGIAVNLLKAGYSVIGCDLREEALERLVKAGGRPVEDAEGIVADSDIVLTSLEGCTYIKVADEILLPNARAGQIFIDHSTVAAPATRRIGAAFVEQGCAYLDAPVSGGAGGANAGNIRIFVGGDEATAKYCWPLFEAMGNPEKIVYGGGIGMGQIVKVVQQLTVRFPDVARMEVMAFGIRAGLDLDTVMAGLDVDPESNDRYAMLYRAIRNGDTDNLSGLFSEWHYYLEEAEALGFPLPMLEGMYKFLEHAEKPGVDAVGRATPSVWNELMKQRR